MNNVIVRCGLEHDRGQGSRLAAVSTERGVVTWIEPARPPVRWEDDRPVTPVRPRGLRVTLDIDELVGQAPPERIWSATMVLFCKVHGIVHGPRWHELVAAAAKPGHSEFLAVRPTQTDNITM